ncbi:MAG: hypothetical protein ABIG55_04230 [Candidatus Omnitrophota bacterium]
MWFAAIGIISFVLSFLYFFMPETVKKMDEIGRKAVLDHTEILDKRRMIGLFYLLAGIGLVYMGIK